MLSHQRTPSATLLFFKKKINIRSETFHSVYYKLTKLREENQKNRKWSTHRSSDFTLLSFIPARCWMAPEIPTAMYNSCEHEKHNTTRQMLHVLHAQDLKFKLKARPWTLAAQCLDEPGKGRPLLHLLNLPWKNAPNHFNTI